MISMNIRSGRCSAIFASASNPSVAVTTSQPSLVNNDSADFRIVLLSSITITFKTPEALPFESAELSSAKPPSCIFAS